MARLDYEEIIVTLFATIPISNVYFVVIISIKPSACETFAIFQVILLFFKENAILFKEFNGYFTKQFIMLNFSIINFQLS